MPYQVVLKNQKTTDLDIAIVHGSVNLKRLSSKYMKYFVKTCRFKPIHYSKIKTRSLIQRLCLFSVSALKCYIPSTKLFKTTQ